MQPECTRRIQVEQNTKLEIEKRREDSENLVHLNIIINNLSMDTCMHTHLTIIIINKDFVDQTSIIVVGVNNSSYQELERYSNSNVDGFNLRCY